MGRSCAVLLLGMLVLAPARAGAEVKLPPGFAAEVYVTGQGFGPSPGQGTRGIPAVSTLGVDQAGALYLARSGRRYAGSSEAEDLWPIYRIPAGGARLTPDSERRYFHGPPLPNPQVAGVRDGRELLVTTFDRERRIGVLYRMLGGRAELIAGGTPEGHVPPALRQPEGAAVDAAGHIYVADRERGSVVRLDPAGRILTLSYVSVLRPRVLAVGGGHLWIGADGEAGAPWNSGPGEIWRVGPDGAASMVLRGPVAGGIDATGTGHLFVADRQAAQIFVLSPEGERWEFVRFTEGDAPRSLAFVPDTPETRRAGLAGSLFVVTIRRGAWPVNEVIRISGPFDEYLRRAGAE